VRIDHEALLTTHLTTPHCTTLHPTAPLHHFTTYAGKKGVLDNSIFLRKRATFKKKAPSLSEEADHMLHAYMYEASIRKVRSLKHEKLKAARLVQMRQERAASKEAAAAAAAKKPVKPLTKTQKAKLKKKQVCV
jgi:hypothetical protein